MSGTSKRIARGRKAAGGIAKQATTTVSELAEAVGKQGAALRKQATRQVKAVRQTAKRELTALTKTARKETAAAKRQVGKVGDRLEKKAARVKKEVRVIEGVAVDSAAKVLRSVRRM